MAGPPASRSLAQPSLEAWLAHSIHSSLAALPSNSSLGPIVYVSRKLAFHSRHQTLRPLWEQASTFSHFDADGNADSNHDGSTWQDDVALSGALASYWLGLRRLNQAEWQRLAGIRDWWSRVYQAANSSEIISRRIGPPSSSLDSSSFTKPVIPSLFLMFALSLLQWPLLLLLLLLPLPPQLTLLVRRDTWAH